MKNRSGKGYFKTFLLVSFTLVLFTFLGVAGYFYFFLSSLNSYDKAGSSAAVSVAPEIPLKNEPVNILVLGTDIGTAGSNNKNDPKRTDTIILMHLSADRNKINLISIPRDTLIRINGKNAKINEANARNGASGAIDAVEKLLNININFYGEVNYRAFREIIDALGGINMKIKFPMDYDDNAQNLHIHFKEGETVVLNGEKAEEFFRWRKNNKNDGLGDRGDLGRIENQHLFIDQVINKFKSPFIVTKIPGMLTAVKKNTETNMDVEQIISYGIIFSKTDRSKITMDTVEGIPKNINSVSYLVFDEEQNKDILKELKY